MYILDFLYNILFNVFHTVVLDRINLSNDRQTQQMLSPD